MQDNLSPAIGKVQTKLSGLDRVAQTAIGTGIGLAFDRAAAAGLRAATGGFAAGVESLKLLETVTTDTAAAIEATGGAAGVTADEIRKLAEKYEGLNAQFDDKAIQDAETRLLRFTAVGKSNFEPTLQAALDLSAALGKDLPSSIAALGKALSDPAKGLGVLKKFGVVIGADAEQKIKDLQKAGDLAGAQAVILEEVNKRFAGAFEARGATAAGKTAKFRDAIEDLQMAFATGLLPVVTNIQTKLTEWLGKPETLAMVQNLGNAIGGLFSDANLDALAGGLSAAASAFGTALDVFSKLPAPLQGIIIAAIGAKKFLGISPGDLLGGAKGLLGGVGGIFSRGSSPAAPLYVSDVAGGLGGGGAAGKGIGTLGKAALGAEAIIGIVAVVATYMEQRAGIDAMGGAIKSQTTDYAKDASTADLKKSLAGVQGEIAKAKGDIVSSIGLTLFGGWDTLYNVESQILAELKTRNKNANADERQNPQTGAIDAVAIGIKSAVAAAATTIGTQVTALRSPLAQIPAAVNGIGPRVATATAGALVSIRTTFGAVGNQIAGALRSDAGARARAEAASSARLTGLATAIRNQKPPTTSILNQTTIPIKVYVNGKLQTNVQTSYRSGTTVRGAGNVYKS